MKNMILATGLSLVLFAGLVQADDYEFDKNHSRITFTVSHQGFSMMPGRFDSFDGSIYFDEDNPSASKLNVTIETASINMDHEALNNHLKSDDFFGVEKHPTMTFMSTSVVVTGDRSYKLTGNLTLLGVTKPVSLDVIYNKGAATREGHKIGFSAHGMLKRSDFGLSFGVPIIGDEINIVIQAEAIRGN